MKLYVVQNSEGKYFRPRGYGGYGEQWQETLEKAKFYPKLGTARTQCSVWYGINPKLGCPVVLEFDLDPTKAVVIPQLDNAIMAKVKKEKKEAKRKREYDAYRALNNQSKVRELLSVLTDEQRKALKL